MTGKRIGYIRVSSVDQNPDRQLEGVNLDKRFIEKASARNQDRPVLQEMLSYAREGDHIFVHSIDRLARNLMDLQTVARCLIDKNVTLSFLKENLVFDGQPSPMSMLLLQVMGSFAEFERALIRERQREGIELAKKKGKYAGRTPSLNADQIVEANEMLKLGVPKVKIARHFNVSRFTVYKYLKVKNE